MRNYPILFVGILLGTAGFFFAPQHVAALTGPTPTIFQQVLQGNVSPPYYPLAPCPSCSTPSYAPVSSSPVTTNPNPPTTSVSQSPCLTGNASIAHRKGHGHRHKKNRGNVSKNMEKLLQFLLDLINKLLALLGLQPITNPNQDNDQNNDNNNDNDNDNDNQQPDPCDENNNNQVPSPAVTTAPLPSTNTPVISVAPVPSSAVPSVGEKYLIITDPTFSSALADFIAFRKNQGFDVFVATTDTTGKTTDSIKKFIQTRYDNTATRPKYLLLVGNVSFIPTWSVSGVRGDIPYAQLEGNDTFPDLSVGRWPVVSAQHIANITKKTISVETTTCPSKKEALFMASEDVKETTQPGQDQACAMMQAHGYTCNKSYPVPPGTTKQVIDAINRGQLFVWYIGHGEPEGWVEGPPVNNDDIAKLTNTVYPVVGSFTCNSCDLPKDAELNFCDAWIQATGGGAAFIGASWSTPWKEEVYFEHSMIKAMYEKGIDRIGPILDYAKKENVAKYPGEMGDNYLNGYNLMGDPALKVPACP